MAAHSSFSFVSIKEQVDVIRDWISSIAHPDAADWITAAAYAAASLLCVRAGAHAHRERERPASLFWCVAGTLLLLSGSNELLDLQSLLTAIVRADAVASGWYDERRAVQFVFVVALAATAMGTALAGLWLTRRTHPSVRLALAGLGFIGVFVLLRAASFHHVDKILGAGWTSFNWASIQEMVGIGVVASGAALYPRKGLRNSRQSARNR